MKVLMLIPHAGVKGSMARLGMHVVDELGRLGVDVTVRGWGRRTDDEVLLATLVGRLRDVVSILSLIHI